MTARARHAQGTRQSPEYVRTARFIASNDIMGVKGIYPYLKQVAWKPKRGAPIYIDASVVIYQLHAVGVKQRINNHHIRGIIYKLLAFLKQEVYPVFIFDGPPPAIKSARRAAATAGITPDGRTAGDAIREVWQALKQLGVPVLRAAGEADALAAQLARAHDTAVVTTDTDALLYGAPRMIAGAATYKAPGTPQYFMDLCIMLGTDYNPRVCSYSVAVEILKKYKSIRAFLAAPAASARHEKYKQRLQNYDQIVATYNTIDPLAAGAPARPAAYAVSRASMQKIMAPLVTPKQMSNIEALKINWMG